MDQIDGHDWVLWVPPMGDSEILKLLAKHKKVGMVVCRHCGIIKAASVSEHCPGGYEGDKSNFMDLEANG